MLKKVLTAAALICSIGSAHAEPVKVNLGFTAVIDYLGAFVAKDQGFFEKHGLDVTLTLMPNGGSIPPGLLSGSLQVGGLTSPSVLQAKAAGIPLQIVTGGTVVTQANPNGWVVARTDVKVSGPKDFEGKRVGTGGVGSYFNVLFRQWLVDNGADPQKVTFVEAPFGQLGDILKSGQIDAATLGQPFLNRIVSAGTGYEVAAYTGSFQDGLLSNVYVATEEWVAANKDAAAGFAAAIEEANAFIEQSPDAARKSAATYLKLPPEVLATVPLSNYNALVTPEQIEMWNGIMRNQDLTETDVTPASLLPVAD